MERGLLLQLLEGPKSWLDRQFVVPGSTGASIGRSLACGIHFNKEVISEVDPEWTHYSTISRKHACLYLHEGEFVLQNLSSTNASVVLRRDQSIRITGKEMVSLCVGDRIRIGSGVVFQVEDNNYKIISSQSTTDTANTEAPHPDKAALQDLDTDGVVPASRRPEREKDRGTNPLWARDQRARKRSFLVPDAVENSRQTMHLSTFYLAKQQQAANGKAEAHESQSIASPATDEAKAAVAVEDRTSRAVPALLTSPQNHEELSPPPYFLDPNKRRERQKITGVQVGSLIGRPLHHMYKDNETSDFRHCMICLRQSVRRNKRLQPTLHTPFIVSAHTHRMPQLTECVSQNGVHIPTPANPPETYTVAIDCPFLSVKETMQCSGETRPVDVITHFAAEHHTNIRHCLGLIANPSIPELVDHLLLKECGAEAFMGEPVPLLNYFYVWRALLRDPDGLVPLQLVAREGSEIIDDDWEEVETKLDATRAAPLDPPGRSTDGTRAYDENLFSATLPTPLDRLTVRVEHAKAVPAWEIPGFDNGKVCVTVVLGLYHGGQLLTAPTWTQIVTLGMKKRETRADVVFDDVVVFETMRIQDIPLATRLHFLLLGCSQKKQKSLNAHLNDIVQSYVKKKSPNTDVLQTRLPSGIVPLGCVNYALIQHDQLLAQGPFSLHLWGQHDVSPIGPCVSNTTDANAPRLSFRLPRYPGPVVFPPNVQLKPEDTEKVPLTSGDEYQLFRIINEDSLAALSPHDLKILQRCGYTLVDKPQALAKYIQSVEWGDSAAVAKAYHILSLWVELPPVHALELLDIRYPDPRVRGFAVSCLQALPDAEFFDFEWQLVQALKNENLHNSPLALMLLERGMTQLQLGHYLFWYLRADMHDPAWSHRFEVVAEAYLRGCGSYRQELVNQNALVTTLEHLAKHIKSLEEGLRQEVLARELHALNKKIKPGLRLPVDPAMAVRSIRVDKCKVLTSATAPLKLVFENLSPGCEDVAVLFKHGDDLRQDMFTLQMMRVMDRLWSEHGLYLCMTIYGCVATGQDCGMVEMVKHSETVARMQMAEGGAMGAFDRESVTKYLQKHNPTPEQYARAVDLFTRSCAGYSVATYLLGLGDRHNDNIMLTTDGRLFHIDFGHFLGNWQRFGIIRRDRTPFVLTPDLVHVMGGKDSDQFRVFVDYCCRAYNVLRAHSSLFFTLFVMMLGTGIPELQSISDIDYLRESFNLHLSEAQATQRFTRLIHDSVSSKAPQVNFFIHNIAQKSAITKTYGSRKSSRAKAVPPAPNKKSTILG